MPQRGTLSWGAVSEYLEEAEPRDLSLRPTVHTCLICNADTLVSLQGNAPLDSTDGLSFCTDNRHPSGCYPGTMGRERLDSQVHLHPGVHKEINHECSSTSTLPPHDFPSFPNVHRGHQESSPPGPHTFCAHHRESPVGCTGFEA